MKVLILAVILSCLGSCCAQTNGDVRLGDPHYFASIVTARVEIYWNGQWGTINYNSDTLYHSGQAAAGTAACKQLGFYDSVDTDTVINQFVRTADDSVPILLRDIDCPYSGSFKEATAHILRCSYKQANGSESHDDDMAVTCGAAIIPDLYNTQVRLVQGGTDYTSSGFVEVYLHDSWGPVCDLGQYDADTVCRQLGYTNAVGLGSSISYFVNINESAKIDEFTCNTDSFQCLYNCFTYPSTSDDFTYCFEYSWVNCTFDETRAEVNSAGGYDLCTYYPPSDSPGPVLTLVTIIPISLIAAFIVVVLSFTIPLICICRGGRERRYTAVSTHSV